jgi:hypothetical protein
VDGLGELYEQSSLRQSVGFSTLFLRNSLPLVYEAHLPP